MIDREKVVNLLVSLTAEAYDKCEPLSREVLEQALLEGIAAHKAVLEETPPVPFLVRRRYHDAGPDVSPRVTQDGKLVVSLWLDDERPSPPGWVRARTVSEVERFLMLGVVENLSLDHDLGTDEEGIIQTNGYDLVKWMAEHEAWPVNRPTVHSQNPVGVANMESVIDRYGPYGSGDQ